jgi:hypothetical protein
MGSKAIIPALVGGAAIAATGGAAAPAVLGAETAGTGAAAGGLGAGLGEGLLADSSLAGVGGLSSIAGGGSAMGALDGASMAGTLGASDAVLPTMDLANSTGITSPSLMDMLKKYGTPDNTLGAAKLMASMPQKQQGQPPQSSASVKQATQMQQALTSGLLDQYSAPVKRKLFSLLG